MASINSPSQSAFLEEMQGVRHHEQRVEARAQELIDQSGLAPEDCHVQIRIIQAAIEAGVEHEGFSPQQLREVIIRYEAGRSLHHDSGVTADQTRIQLLGTVGRTHHSYTALPDPKIDPRGVRAYIEWGELPQLEEDESGEGRKHGSKAN